MSYLSIPLRSSQGGAHDSSSLRERYIDLLRHFNPLLRAWVEDKVHAEGRQAALQRARRSMDTAAADMLRPAVEESAPGAPIVIAMGWVVVPHVED